MTPDGAANSALRPRLMTTVEICPACKQPMRHQRCGVFLSPLKTSMFDLVQRAGEAGISKDELMQELYRDGPMPGSGAIKVHLCQINKVLAGTNRRIVSEGRRWFLRKG